MHSACTVHVQWTKCMQLANWGFRPRVPALPPMITPYSNSVNACASAVSLYLYLLLSNQKKTRTTI